MRTFINATQPYDRDATVIRPIPSPAHVVADYRHRDLRPALRSPAILSRPAALSARVRQEPGMLSRGVRLRDHAGQGRRDGALGLHETGQRAVHGQPGRAVHGAASRFLSLPRLAVGLALALALGSVAWLTEGGISSRFSNRRASTSPSHLQSGYGPSACSSVPGPSCHHVFTAGSGGHRRPDRSCRLPDLPGLQALDCGRTRAGYHHRAGTERVRHPSHRRPEPGSGARSPGEELRLRQCALKHAPCVSISTRR
jgi:hypothetical protein